ncbi:unnamed protein product [Trichobilharzia regenti]|nr:unnamed protein product [Trichobilharzia regenti]
MLASDNNNNTNISLPDCLNTVTASTTASGVAINNEVLSDDESRLDANTTSNPVTTSWDSTTNTSATTTTATTSSLSNTNSVGSSSSVNLSSYGAAMPGSREPVYVSYIRYMAKFMPAGWLVRSAQALKLNVNQINCDTNMIWLNALIGRLLWDFLREAYWLERIRNKIQAKLKKIHCTRFPEPERFCRDHYTICHRLKNVDYSLVSRNNVAAEDKGKMLARRYKEGWVVLT